MDKPNIGANNYQHINIGSEPGPGTKHTINRPITLVIFSLFILLLVTIIFILMIPNQQMTGKVLGTHNSRIASIGIIGIIFTIIILGSFLYGMLSNGGKKSSYSLHWITFLLNMKDTFILFLYMIALILIFALGNKNAINYYAGSILLVLVPFGLFLFYRAMKNIKTTINLTVNYNFIKYAIIYFCLLMFIGILYLSNPGNYISKYSGSFMGISWLTLLFGFLFLITFFQFPAINDNGTDKTGLFRGFTLFSIINVICFILFTVMISYYLNIHQNSPNFVAIAILAGSVCIFWILFTIMRLGLPNSDQLSEEGKLQSNLKTYFINIILLLSGTGFSSMLIYWIIFSVQASGSKTSTFRLLMNILVILIALGIVFKLLSTSDYYEKWPILRLIIDTIFYIPCLVVNVYDLLIHNIFQPIYRSILGSTSKYGPEGIQLAKQAVTNISDTKTSYYVILAGVITVYLVKYIVLPKMHENKAQQGGTLIVNKPLALNTVNTLGGYKELNAIPDFVPSEYNINNPTYPYNYMFAMSFWLFLDGSFNQNSQNNVNDTIVLDIFNIIKIYYNSQQNTLKFKVLKNDKTQPLGDTTNNNDDYVYLYGLENILQQKWNNIVLNYNNGTLDIFYNGTLVNTSTNVVPNMEYNTIVSGENTNGIQGGICNVNYFNKPLTNDQIYFLYNTMKSVTPPAPLNNADTLIPVQNRQKAPTTDIAINSASIINIKLPFDFDIPKVSLDISDDTIKTVPDSVIDPNYLSLKWFFSNNGNKNSGLE